MEHDDDIEILSRTSNHQTEIIGQYPSNSILASVSKHLTPPNKNREVPPPRKIISHCKKIRTNKNLSNNSISKIFDYILVEMRF